MIFCYNAISLCLCQKRQNVMSRKVRGSDVSAKLKLKTTEIKSNYFTKQIKKINIFHEKSLRIRRFIVKSRRQFSWEWPLGFVVLFAQMIWPLSVMTVPLQFITFILCNNTKRPKYVSWMEPEVKRAFTRFTKLLIELTRTSFLQTSNELEHVHLLVIKLEHPIFGFERLNIIRSITCCYI